ncbi:MAG: hypothetical protein LR011_12205 [Verrucomicrobia bacterium]|nr:hypothetical protein [Verrucomicrobiota bacterium]
MDLERWATSAAMLIIPRVPRRNGVSPPHIRFNLPGKNILPVQLNFQSPISKETAGRSACLPSVGMNRDDVGSPGYDWHTQCALGYVPIDGLSFHDFRQGHWRQVWIFILRPDLRGQHPTQGNYSQ